MMRRRKIALIVAGSLAALVLLLTVSAVLIARSEWFANLIRERIVREVETATGGRAEIGRFALDWRRLTATVENFVLHGLEPAGSPPLFRARRIQLELKIVSVFRRKVDLAALTVDQPQAFVQVMADGRTNLPEPKAKRQAGSPLRTIVDLAIGRFELSDGLVDFASRRTPLNLRGENLRARLDYDALQTLYRGEVAMDPFLAQRPPGSPPVRFRLTAPVVIDEDRIDVADARLQTASSLLIVNGSVENMADPRGSLRLNGKLALEEFDRAFRLELPAELRRGPPLQVQLDATIEQGVIRLAEVRLGLGKSNLEGSGVIRDLTGPAGRIDFRARLSLDELGRLAGGATRAGGRVDLNGTVEFEDTSRYRLTSKVDAHDLSVRQDGRVIRGLSATGRLSATPGRVQLSDLLVRGFGGTFSGSVRLADGRRLEIEGQASGLDIEELLAASGAQAQPWTGRISGPISIRGDLRRPGLGLEARAKVEITPGPGELPVTGSLDLSYDAGRGVLDLGTSHLALPHTRADVTGSLGRQIQVRLVSTDLNDLLPVLAMVSPQAPKTLPLTLRNGTASFTGTVTGTTEAPVIAGRLELTNFEVEGRVFDRLAVDVNASPSQVALSNGTLSRGTLRASFEGMLGLDNFRPQPSSVLSVRASLANGQIKDLMALAGQQDDFAGLLTANLTAGGTWGDPQVTADVAIRDSRLYGEPFERIQAKLGYAGRVVSISPLEVESGSARMKLTASYQHASDDLRSGRLAFRLDGNRVDLLKFPAVQRRWPGLTGALEMKADGTADLRQTGGQPQVMFSSLNANVAARGLTLNNQPFGDLTLTAETSAGAMAFRLASDFAGSAIQGDGVWQLSGNYPLQAKVVFKSVWLSAVRRGLSATPQAPLPFDALAEGRLTISGPVLEREKMRASVEVTRLEAGPVQNGKPGTMGRVVLRNDGPMVVALDGPVLRVERARLTGPQTELTASGKVAFDQKNPLDLKIAGNAQLDMVQDFMRDVYASGAITLNTTVRGTLAKPLVTGRVDLKEASVNIADIPTGISNASGSIRFDGAQASIENITAESGGGKLILSGFVAYGTGELVFRIVAKAEEVRVRYPEGVSTTSNVELTWTGTSQRSTLSGTVTILRAGFNPSSDLGSILAQTTQPVRTPAARGGIMDGVRFDVQIQSAPNLQFQSALARDIQADANLRLRGSFTNPALLGRITITQGEINFFGTRYDIQQGSIAFYNPVRVEPVLNIDLETKARGITVVLNVSGPVNRLNLTHRSDPPLPFSEVVALLATGRAPTSDPGLAARDTAQGQSFQQMGASALLGSAIANPVAGRLQRLFGVSRLKIDPSFSGVENNPQARLTLEQQITRDITFTYITNLARGNYQVVRVEWAFSRQWSVVALREENGLVGIDFLYKKRFR